jgi:hypothetical protein
MLIFPQYGLLTDNKAGSRLEQFQLISTIARSVEKFTANHHHLRLGGSCAAWVVRENQAPPLPSLGAVREILWVAFFR